MSADPEREGQGVVRFRRIQEAGVINVKRPAFDGRVVGIIAGLTGMTAAIGGKSGGRLEQTHVTVKSVLTGPAMNPSVVYDQVLLVTLAGVALSPKTSVRVLLEPEGSMAGAYTMVVNPPLALIAAWAVTFTPLKVRFMVLVLTVVLPSTVVMAILLMGPLAATPEACGAGICEPRKAGPTSLNGQ